MPGENSLLPQYYNDDFQVTVLSYPAAAIHDPTAVLYADRDLIVDEIVVGVHTAPAAAATFNFEVNTDCTSASGTSMCTINVNSTNIASGDTLVATTDSVLRYNSSGVLQTTATGSTAINAVTAGVQSNLIPKGSWLIVDPDTATGARAIIQIRFRSRLK
jgi:hypothetical protein